MSALTRRADVGLVFLVGLLIWLLNHPYQGIWHDARIYGLLAARWLQPEAYARDLFFSFGSQGELSLFTPVFGVLVGWLGLSRAAWWVTLSGGVLWMAASLAVTRRMLGSGFAAWFAFFLGAVVVISYSPNRATFYLGENFATARSWAIPLGLASVAALAAKQQWRSLALSLAAASLHPLHGIWPLALWLLAQLRGFSAVTLASLPVVAVAVLGLMNPDVPYLRLMSGQWLEFASGANDIIFKSPPDSRLPHYTAALVVIWLAARRGSAPWRPLYLRLLLLGIVGLALAAIASYALAMEIVVQAQPWRVMSLLIPMAAIALVDLGRLAWNTSVAGRLMVCALAVLASIGLNWLMDAIWVVALASLMPTPLITRAEAWVEHWRNWLGGALVVLALLAVPNLLARWEIAGAQWLNPWWAGAEWLQGLVAGASWHLAALLALIPGWLLGNERSAGRSRKPLRSVAVIALLAAVAIGMMATLYHWDRRASDRRSAEACYLAAKCPPHPFRQWVSPGDVVFWPEREMTVWFALGTASYFGEIQSTGKVFSPAKFYEWQRRQTRVAAGTDPRHLCVDPLIDWVVLSYAAAGLAAQAVVRDGHLYGCAALRAVPPAPTSAWLRVQ